jgi:hypothetical protein
MFPEKGSFNATNLNWKKNSKFHVKTPENPKNCFNG